ncbi:type II secretion system protein, partial [Salmonella enterica]|uniref:type II secretion system protein n=1 Tax=Salmonella enterica TaxID=28901 RepID=UPI0029548849
MKAISLRDIRKRFMAQPEKYLNLKKQRGMTLLEIIIVLGIIGTIAAGVVILAQRAYDAKAMTDLTTNINTNQYYSYSNERCLWFNGYLSAANRGSHSTAK